VTDAHERSGISDAVVGVSLAALGSWMIWEAQSITGNGRVQYDPVGAGAVPEALGICLAVLGALLIVRAVLSRRITRTSTQTVELGSPAAQGTTPETVGADGELLDEEESGGAALLAMAVCVLYAILLPLGGFVLMTFLASYALGRILAGAGHDIRLIIVSVLVTASCYVFFVEIVGIRIGVLPGLD
jgi:hypothetical protein